MPDSDDVQFTSSIVKKNLFEVRSMQQYLCLKIYKVKTILEIFETLLTAVDPTSTIVLFPMFCYSRLIGMKIVFGAKVSTYVCLFVNDQMYE
jgi:hypothetical protein